MTARRGEAADMAWMDGWMCRTEAAAEGGAHLRVQRRARHVGDAQGRHTTTHHCRQGPLLGDVWRPTAARSDVVWSAHPPSRATLLRGFRLIESGPVIVRPSLSVVTAAGGGLAGPVRVVHTGGGGGCG